MTRLEELEKFFKRMELGKGQEYYEIYYADFDRLLSLARLSEERREALKWAVGKIEKHLPQGAGHKNNPEYQKLKRLVGE